MVSVCLPCDALLPPTHLGFSYLGCGVSLYSCFSKAQPLLLTLDEGYLLTAALPDLQCGIAPLGPPAPTPPRLRDWNTKVGSQETPGVTGKFGLGVQNVAGQRLIEFYQENTLVMGNTLFQQHERRLYIWTSLYGRH